MANEDAVRKDAMRLLWAMNKHKVGDEVHPSGAAHEAGLIPDTDRYNDAVAYLVRKRVIEPNEEVPGHTIAGIEDPFYRITPRGWAMLLGYFPE
jgi:hypothetical protein